MCDFWPDDGMVDMKDSKSFEAIRVGSSPTLATKKDNV